MTKILRGDISSFYREKTLHPITFSKNNFVPVRTYLVPCPITAKREKSHRQARARPSSFYSRLFISDACHFAAQNRDRTFGQRNHGFR
jgi:hypothetical protein